MAGKSTYIKQVALLTIMAHVGSFVPAKFASLRVVDKLFIRIGTDDNMESNSGSFLVEMKEIAYIIQNATNRSLILIDELGRGTSNIEGNSIAWSICEVLMSFQAYTIFVTHYLQLVELEMLYPNVKNFHCMVSTTEGRLNFIYNIGEGSCNEDNYGIKLARMLGLPSQITSQAEDICRQIVLERKRKAEQENTRNQHVNDLRSCYHLAHHLQCLKHSSMDIETMMKYLQSLQLKHQELLQIIVDEASENLMIEDLSMEKF
jgi:DNA mismatch repair protein MSH4